MLTLLVVAVSAVICVCLIDWGIEWWCVERSEARRRQRHMIAARHANGCVAVILEGCAIQNVTEVLEGEWLIAIAVDPETGKLMRCWSDPEGAPLLDYATVTVWGDVKVASCEDALDLPPYCVTLEGTLFQPPLIPTTP